MKYCVLLQVFSRLWSPSMRREWIEMCCILQLRPCCQMSPSMRREWIEIYSLRDIKSENSVSLHAEGVD